ncbi:MAG: carboxymuconolactone decarboxylase family protein [Anaerolineaceae bacterium]|nr:carboxymuconolactone decarboxylase family protein [Anaerolineaceae bacterium]
MKRKFPRRYYNNPIDFFRDFSDLMKKRSLIREAMRIEISMEFRERLMLMVTEVNGCRYCSYYHARLALEAGISGEELNELLSGSIPQNAPSDEIPALFYAQHWAEKAGNADDEATEKITQLYGQKKTDAIHIVLRMIRMGNLLGNTWDFVLYQLSFGKLGLQENENLN